MHLPRTEGGLSRQAKVTEAYDTLKDKMNVVYVSDDASEAKSGPWCPFRLERVRPFSSFGDVSAPTLMVLQKNSSVSSKLLLRCVSSCLRLR